MSDSSRRLLQLYLLFTCPLRRSVSYCRQPFHGRAVLSSASNPCVQCCGIPFIMCVGRFWRFTEDGRSHCPWVGNYRFRIIPVNNVKTVPVTTKTTVMDVPVYKDDASMTVPFQTSYLPWRPHRKRTNPSTNYSAIVLSSEYHAPIISSVAWA
jgi:hypothetical protein